MSRRARPTLRVLREDPVSGWENPFVRRALAAGAVSDLQPLNALQHPILQKAAASFTDVATEDSFVGPIACVNSTVLLEVKQGQWRAGVWIDDEACWVIAAGLAKGDHNDHDDFYRRLERFEQSHAISDLLPDAEDRTLLKKERAHAAISAWQLHYQEQIITALSSALEGGTGELIIASPMPSASADEVFASVELTVVVNEEPDDRYEDIVVEIAVTDRWKNSKLVWPFTTHLLAAISPPEQGWDRSGDIYSNLLEVGSLAERLEELRQLSARQEIARTVPGATAHYAHRRDLTERSVEGRATRALCGVYFVPRQDAEALEPCTTCSTLHGQIPEE